MPLGLFFAVAAMMPDAGHFELTNLDKDFAQLGDNVFFEGKVVSLVGIDHTGRVANCRPFAPGMASEIADRTCAILKRRGHYVFAANAKRPKGIRYLRFALIWRRPN
ncbi:MAG: hypothetical protein RL367_1560 [Pseudomonadota bacterium]|jgi:hypothetical protein